MIFNLLLTLAVIVLDVVSKLGIMHTMTVGDSIQLIPHVLRFTYVQNKGAAFGMLAGNRAVFLVLSTVMIVALLVFLIRVKGYSKLCYVSASLILAGGIGNMIDRLLYGFVVDFIDFCAFDFWTWVFNVADVSVCVGAGLFALYLLAFDKKAKSKGFKSILYEETKPKTGKTHE